MKFLATPLPLTKVFRKAEVVVRMMMMVVVVV